MLIYFKLFKTLNFFDCLEKILDEGIWIRQDFQQYKLAHSNKRSACMHLG